MATMFEGGVRKRVIIAGATGLVGKALYRLLDPQAFSIAIVGRSRDKLKEEFPSASGHMSWGDLELADPSGIDTIVNLAGANVSGERWNRRYKQVMRDSRINATLACVDKCRQNPAIRLVNASAVSTYGFYTEAGLRFTEGNRDARSGTAYLQEMIDEWEAAAREAEAGGSRVTLIRTGVVFDLEEGAFPALIKPFRLFVGGWIGTGRQVISWISTQDITRIIALLLDRSEMTGPINCTAPGAVPNREFATLLGHALGRPSLVRSPAFAIRALMGQMGDELIVKGQHVYPERLLAAGFQFRHPTLKSYLADTFKS